MSSLVSVNALFLCSSLLLLCTIPVQSFPTGAPLNSCVRDPFYAVPPNAHLSSPSVYNVTTNPQPLTATGGFNYTFSSPTWTAGVPFTVYINNTLPPTVSRTSFRGFMYWAFDSNYNRVGSWSVSPAGFNNTNVPISQIVNCPDGPVITHTAALGNGKTAYRPHSLAFTLMPPAAGSGPLTIMGVTLTDRTVYYPITLPAIPEVVAAGVTTTPIVNNVIPNPIYLTAAQLATHNVSSLVSGAVVPPSDCYISLYGGIYNATDWAHYHAGDTKPSGGALPCGTDATAAYAAVPAHNQARIGLYTYYLGGLLGYTGPSAATIPTAAPTATSAPLTYATVALHKTPASCWTVIAGVVYDMTYWIPQHPGGSLIEVSCGVDGTAHFALTPLHNAALLPYQLIRLGALVDTPTPAPTTPAPPTTAPSYTCPISFPYQCTNQWSSTVCFNDPTAAANCNGPVGSWCAFSTAPAQIQSFLASGAGMLCTSPAATACPAAYPFVSAQWSSTVCFNTATYANSGNGALNSWCALPSASAAIASFVTQGFGVNCNIPQTSECPPSFPFLSGTCYDSAVCYNSAKYATSCNGPIGSWCALSGAPSLITGFVAQGYGAACPPVPTTAQPTTATTAAAPSTATPSTATPSTAVPSTVAPSTGFPSTVAPSTTAPATETTAAPTTTAPTTAPTTMAADTTLPATTVTPTTDAPSTAAPSTAGPTTTVAPPATTTAATTPAPVTTNTISLSVVAAHNTAASCYMAINGNVYDATNFISSHPGGSIITSGCGIDASILYSIGSTLHVPANLPINCVLLGPLGA